MQYDAQSYLEDTEDALESADYLRAWIFELQLRDYLRSKFGNTWYAQRAAGLFLKEIWETGQLYSVEELCREIGLGATRTAGAYGRLVSGSYEMKRVKVHLEKRSYPIMVGDGLLEQSGDIFKELGFSRPPVVISNPRVMRLHGRRLLRVSRTRAMVPSV